MPTLSLLLPANWSEIITSGKFSEVMKILNTSFPDEGASRFEMLKALTGLNGYDLGKQLGAATKKQRQKLSKEISYEDAEEIVQKVFPALDFIFKNEKFHINPFPKFTHKGITYAGPDSGKLSDQTGDEWMASHHFHFQYSQNQEIKYLQNIVAANYHRVENGRRAEYHKDNMTRDAEAITTLPEEIINGIILWYNHADAWWVEQFPWLFSSGEGTGEMPDGHEIRALMLELSGNKIDSAWDTVIKRTRQEIIFLLDHLEKKREDSEEK